MVLHFRHATGTPVEQRDARGEHSIIIPAADKAEALSKMAPQVFVLLPSGEAVCDYGQFVSLLFASVARLSPAGAPLKSFGTHRLSIGGVGRLWATILEIISQRSESELATLRLPSTARGGGQRGEFIAALRALRNFATPLQLSRFELTDADFEDISAGAGYSPALEHPMPRD